ncbi:MAG: sodium:proton antiporter [Polyangia bacterium]|jgi:multicomponent Na+:H+ antiporter subunit C
MTLWFVPYLVAAWLFGWGLYGIVSSRNLVHLVLCLALLQTATYVLLMGIGWRAGGVAPVLVGTHPGQSVVDPIVQALMLTDIVVEATVMALLLAMAVQLYERLGTVDPACMRVLRG